MKTAYSILYGMLMTGALPVLGINALFSEKRRKTLLQRLGVTGSAWLVAPASRRPRIWLHALSVGEVLSAQPLVDKISKECASHDLILSASTFTGFETVRRETANRAAGLMYFPYDFPFSVKKAVNAVRPFLAVIVETDIWPNFLFEMQARRIPTLLVNARLSDRSFAGYRRFSSVTRPVFSSLAGVCAQAEADARRFRALGVPASAVSVTGNIKFDQPEETVSDAELSGWRTRLGLDGRRKCILAGSLHRGEPEIICRAARKLTDESPVPLLVIAPRNLENVSYTVRVFRGQGFRTVRWTRMSSDDPTPEVVILDVMGVLRRLYAIADVAFVGGSLAPAGGHNPLEPAAWSKPVIFGPDMRDFKWIAGRLLDAGGAAAVRDGEGLYQELNRLLTDAAGADAMGRNARRVFTENKGAVENTWQVIQSFLPET